MIINVTIALSVGPQCTQFTLAYTTFASEYLTVLPPAKLQQELNEKSESDRMALEEEIKELETLLPDLDSKVTTVIMEFAQFEYKSNSAHISPKSNLF